MHYDDKDVTDQLGVTIPASDEERARARDLIRDGVRAMTKEQREDFIARLDYHGQKEFLERMLIPDLRDPEELERWLAE